MLRHACKSKPNVTQHVLSMQERLVYILEVGGVHAGARGGERPAEGLDEGHCCGLWGEFVGVFA